LSFEKFGVLPTHRVTLARVKSRPAFRQECRASLSDRERAA
jgi:hypothetical protein